MSDGRRGLLALVTSVTALTLVAATCRKDPAPATSAPAPAADPSPAAAPAAAAAAPTESSGLDLSTLPEAARTEVQKVLSDEFCYCGCPHTIGGCLKEHATCEHAKHEAQLAAWLAEAGEHSFEIIAELGRYYRSFKEARQTFDLTNTACRGPADAAVTVVENVGEPPVAGTASNVTGPELGTRACVSTVPDAESPIPPAVTPPEGG